MRIAVLDDDASLGDYVSQVLGEAGHSCHTYQEGRRLVNELRRESFDLLILDWEVPDMSGLEVLTWVRSSIQDPLPVLFLTCRSEETDIVAGLAAGADDYMVKPMRRAELMARVFALLRRAYPQQQGIQQLTVEPFEFDATAKTIVRDGVPLEVTHKEFDLAFLLFRNLGRLLSRSHIQEAVWGHDHDLPSRTMDTHISRVRSKLQLRPEHGFRLTPVYSFGYRLEQVGADV